MAPSHVGDPCPRHQALHQDLSFPVCRPPPHRAGDYLDPTIRPTLMPALITALMPAAIHCTARTVASASVSAITSRFRKVVHSHWLRFIEYDRLIRTTDPLYATAFRSCRRS
jgi:hypothetical protein